MKYTGMMRRIDSLGRIVIPKEIRNKLKLKENENIDILVEDEKIILKKHTVLNTNEKLINNIGKVLDELLNINILITNREKIIYANKSNRLPFLNKELSDYLIDSLLNRESIDENTEIEIIKNVKISSEFYSLPIIFNSDVIGLIIVYSNKLSDIDKLTVKIINKFLSYSLN